MSDPYQEQGNYTSNYTSGVAATRRQCSLQELDEIMDNPMSRPRSVQAAAVLLFCLPYPFHKPPTKRECTAIVSRVGSPAPLMLPPASRTLCIYSIASAVTTSPGRTVGIPGG
mmetsp:Transcript_52694/g.167497  ORF Transcript_52694/g.167497 Transcript_52694/m.167497 type:complete len:113 (-) Transcript_52694:123-461(-)